MLPASNRGLGTSIHFPDVCKTPAGPMILPLPYPDIAMNAMAVPFSPTVFVGFVPATNMASMKMMTMGDEAGVAGGLLTGAIKMQGNTLMGNPTVLWNCLPAEHMLVPTAGNNFNAPLGAQLVPSLTSTFVMLAPEEDGEIAGEVEARVEDLARVDRARDDGNVTVARKGEALHLVIRLFDTDVPRAVFNALSDHEGPILIDLRGNRGGDVDAALSLADDFLDDGLVMARSIDDGDEELHLSQGAPAHRGAVTLWIDRRTASAAELFAAAIVDQGRGVLYGERSYGKATAQTLITGPREGPRYGTVQRFLRADGSSWEAVGLVPDHDGRPPWT